MKNDVQRTSRQCSHTAELGVLIYKTVSDRLVTREQSRKMGFMGRTAFIESKFVFVFLEPKTISINFFYFFKLEKKN